MKYAGTIQYVYWNGLWTIGCPICLFDIEFDWIALKCMLIFFTAKQIGRRSHRWASIFDIYILTYLQSLHLNFSAQIKHEWNNSHIVHFTINFQMRKIGTEKNRWLFCGRELFVISNCMFLRCEYTSCAMHRWPDVSIWSDYTTVIVQIPSINSVYQFRLSILRQIKSDYTDCALGRFCTGFRLCTDHCTDFVCVIGIYL